MQVESDVGGEPLVTVPSGWRVRSKSRTRERRALEGPRKSSVMAFIHCMRISGMVSFTVVEESRRGVSGDGAS